MTNILYRSTSTPTTPVSSIVKGSPLTSDEFDANLKSISDDIGTKANIASPTFTGTPAAPTATTGTSTNQIATTAFVANQIISSISPLATISYVDASTAPLATVAALNNKSNIASPTFTGTPAAPTAAQGTNTTQIATSAFVLTEISTERSSVSTISNKTILNPTLTEVVLTDSANVTWDMNLGQNARWLITGTGHNLVTPTNYKVGSEYKLLIGLNTPSTMTPNWPTSFKFSYDTPPDLTTSSWTLLTLYWSVPHSKFLVSYHPGF